MALVRRLQKLQPVSAAEYDAVVDQVEVNQGDIQVIAGQFADSQVTLSFADLATATAYWTAEDTAGNTPTDEVEIYIQDVKQFFKWDASNAAKAVFSRDSRIVDYVKYQKYTTANKNLIDVSDTTVTYVVFDSDLNRLEIYKDGAWGAVSDQESLALKADKTETQLINQKIITSLNTTEEATSIYSNDLQFTATTPLNVVNLKKGVKYTITATSSDNLTNGLRFYTNEAGTPLIKEYPNTTNFATGISFEFMPTQDLILSARTTLTSVSVQIDVVYLKSESQEIKTIKENVSNSETNINTNQLKIDDTLNPTLKSTILTDGLKTTTNTTINLIGVSVVEGKRYKFEFSSASSLTSGLVFYEQDANNIIVNYPNTTDFTNTITFEYTANLTGELYYRTQIVGSEVNIKVTELEYTSDSIESISSNTSSIVELNKFFEDYAFYQLIDYNVTATTPVNYSLTNKDFLGKNVDAYLKAPFTGLFRIYSRNSALVLTEIFALNTNFTDGVNFNFTIPADSNELAIRTGVILTINEYKLIDKRIVREKIDLNQWVNAKVGLYGDSITAVSNGNFLSPFSDQTKWGNILARELQLSSIYGRGIGGQKYTWNTGGGPISFINADGTFHSRNDAFNLDNYTGTIPAGTTPIRSCYCSWLRIKTMFPASIKDDIKAVIIKGGTNDDISTVETPLAWVANDTRDPEWASSSEYATYGGDYNITGLEGAVQSTIMKFQAWMPNARIIIATPLSGRGTTGQLNMDNPITEEYTKSLTIRKIANINAIPIVDVNAKCGINGMNRVSVIGDDFIDDAVHNYSLKGQYVLALVIAGDMKSIYPFSI
jgi:hypothetical protein